MPKSLPLVQLQVLAPLLSELRAHGVDPEPVLESVGLTLSAVEQEGTSVHVMVMHQFAENCAEAVGDHTFCAKVGSQLDPTGWPMIRMAFEQSTTLGDFLNIYVAQASLVASSVTAYVEVRGDTVTFGEERKFKPLIEPAQNDGFMIGLKVAILERALGDRMDPQRVILALCDPSVLPSTFDHFQALRGNRMGPRIQFPSEWLSTHIPHSVAGVDSTELLQGNRQGDFLSGLRGLLSQQIGKGGLKADETAKLLHLSKRKLARQLSNLGTSISKELSRAKIEYAKDALKGSDRPVEEIASELGYSDPSNFARAFAKEESLKPSQYRSQHR
ncbi:MAG: helix-turn-helix domain-containing protein [Sneathiella sp.]